ncbi:MAG: 50S ribosomal protein L23 [Sedimentisphaeraceae bacterium JB056]
MDSCNIIIRPIITEQSMHFANTQNAYAFKVNKGANKFQIKKAIEDLYEVKVSDVRTMNRIGKERRRGRNIGRTSSWKKAIVVLNEKYKIDLF